MNYKLKHLAKYCTKPADEFEFNLIKEHAEKGGVNWYNHPTNRVVYFNRGFNRIQLAFTENHTNNQNCDVIPVLDFCKKLRMSEEEAEKLEDDRVKFKWLENYGMIGEHMGAKALNGHYFKTNEDGTEVTLHKRD